MENNISFNGFQNTGIFKRSYKKFGVYCDNNGDIKRGNKLYTDILLKCDITDDCKGADYTKLLKTLFTCCKSSQIYKLFDTNLTNIELMIKRIVVREKKEVVTNSQIFINGKKIKTSEREILPLFTYFAYLTRKLSKSKHLSFEQRKCINTVNKSIYEEAMRFIENM